MADLLLPKWDQLVGEAIAARGPILKAETFRERLGSFSKPVRVSCNDGNVYVLKGRQHGRGADLDRSLVNEQVVGTLGQSIGAAVSAIALVDVTDLVAVEAQMNHMLPGIAHGSRNVPDTSDRKGIEHIHVQENRTRFATLAILYSWVGCFSDHQFIYGNNAPNLVYSVDHGHHLGDTGPVWDQAMLKNRGPALMDSAFGPCALTDFELRPTRAALQLVTAQQIAAAVAAPPDAWGISLQERVELAEYVYKRKMEIIAL